MHVASVKYKHAPGTMFYQSKRAGRSHAHCLSLQEIKTCIENFFFFFFNLHAVSTHATSTGKIRSSAAVVILKVYVKGKLLTVSGIE